FIVRLLMRSTGRPNVERAMRDTLSSSRQRYPLHDSIVLCLCRTAGLQARSYSSGPRASCSLMIMSAQDARGPARLLTPPQRVVRAGHGIAEHGLGVVTLVQHAVDGVRPIGRRQGRELAGQFLRAPAPDVGDDHAIAAVERLVDVALDRLGMLFGRPAGMADGAG